MLTKTKRPTATSRAALQESNMSPDCRVDRQAGVIRGVKILGSQSRNGRSYSPQAMQDAAKLYEDCRVNLDHPDLKTPRVNRSIRDLIGTLHNIRVSQGGVFGDLHLIKAHPHAAGIMEAAETKPRYFGLSHNAMGDMAKNGVVNSISEVRSVDLVQHPATNAGLFESVAPPVRMSANQMKKEIAMLTKRLDQPVRRTLREMDSLDYAGLNSPDESAAVAAPAIDWDDIQQQVATIIADASLSDRQRLDCLHDLVHQHDAVPTLAESCSDVGTVEFSGGQTVGRGPRPRPVPQQTSAESTRRQADFLRSIGAKRKV